ncbi:MAG: biotin transporter BioY [Vallitaleaceae bacterium]|nr:biotin transporter BioY [Vallitaleaceae bacterium]
MTYAALFAALTAVGAWIKLPIGTVPYSMQIFFVIFAGILLGSKLGLLSQLVYILLGLAGIQVFTKPSGLQYIFEPTFGFLLGFALGAFVAGLIVERLKKNNFVTYIIATLGGLVVVYACGVPFLWMIQSLYLGKEFSFALAVKYGFLPFIVKDLVTCVVISMIAPPIVKVLTANRLLKRPE